MHDDTNIENNKYAAAFKLFVNATETHKPKDWDEAFKNLVKVFGEAVKLETYVDELEQQNEDLRIKTVELMREVIELKEETVS